MSILDQPAGQNDTERSERRVMAKLDSLPDPIRRTWEDQYWKAVNDGLVDAYEEDLQNLIDKRNRFLRGKPRLFDRMRHRVVDQAAVDKTLQVIYDAENDPTLYVGEGKTAHVFKDPHIPNLCYKYVKNLVEYEEWNSVESEAEFLEALENLSFEGARVPALSGVIDQPETKVIAMELIEAPSLDQILLKKRQLPPDFDPKIFFRRLRGFMEQVHLRNIYHRDLHEGNVIVGPDNTPYVIDFGKAVYSISPDSAYEAYDRTHTHRVILNSDDDQIYALEQLARRHLAQRNIAA